MSSTRIPLASLSRQYQAIKSEVDAAIHGVIENTAFVRGSGVGSFERDFAEYSETAAVYGCGNGTDALYLALHGLGIGRGDEVITVSHTFIGTIEGIVMAGADPVFVDIDDRTMLIDPSLIEAAITPRTKAIMPVHLYGQPCEMTAINEIAEKHGLFVVEDAAQAHGARWEGRRVGSLGHAAAFSFFPGKNLGAYGDGGAVASTDEKLIEKIRSHANHGRLDKYTHSSIGINSRLDTVQAVVLAEKLKHLDDWNVARRSHANVYDEFYDDCQIRHQMVAAGAESVYHLYVIRVDAGRRDDVVAKLNAEGIDAGIHYPTPLHKQAALAGLPCSKVSLPVTERAADEVLSLPIFPEMNDEELERVMKAVQAAV